MNTKISMPELAAILALRTSLSSEECEAFLRQYVAIVSEALEEGDSVKIKDFGTFKLTAVESRRSISVVNGDEVEIPAHKRITFIPSKELASEINAPFEAFEAVEIPDDEATDEVEQEIPVSPEDQEVEEITPISLAQREIEESDYIFDSAPEDDQPVDAVEVTETDSVAVYADASDDNQEESVSPAKEPVAEFTDESDYRIEEAPASVAPASAIAQKPVSSKGDERVEQPTEISESGRRRRYSSRSFLKGFLLGILTTIIIMIVAVGILAVFRKNIVHLPEGYDIEALVVAEEHDADVKGAPVKEKSTPADVAESSEKSGEATDASKAAVEKESVEVPTAASDTPKEPEPVYDTVSTTRYLTTMAKEHYGNYHLWPYIYEENKAILGHPDRIRPGTKVRIPSLSKYGVDPKNPSDIARAKKMGVAIYARYK